MTNQEYDTMILKMVDEAEALMKDSSNRGPAAQGQIRTYRQYLSQALTDISLGQRESLKPNHDKINETYMKLLDHGQVAEYYHRQFDKRDVENVNVFNKQ